jgi:hypothetical protein
MALSQREQFEWEYIRRSMPDIAVEAAKRFMEEHRDGNTYSDDDIAEAWADEKLGIPWYG